MQDDDAGEEDTSYDLSSIDPQNFEGWLLFSAEEYITPEEISNLEAGQILVNDQILEENDWHISQMITLTYGEGSREFEYVIGGGYDRIALGDFLLDNSTYLHDIGLEMTEISLFSFGYRHWFLPSRSRRCR